MIDVHPIAPENELRVAERLKAMIAATWPDLAEDKNDRIDILVGVRTPIDVDLLVIVRLNQAREIPRLRLRGGEFSVASQIKSALVAIEIKQQDQGQFDVLGNQLFPINNGRRSDRSCSKQAKDAALGIASFARQYGCDTYVHSLAWLTQVDETFLRPMETVLVGREATWLGMLATAAHQHVPYDQAEVARTAQAAGTIRQVLLNRRPASRRTRALVEKLSRARAAELAVHPFAKRVGHVQLRLIGRGGSGKTTSLALLAIKCAERGERVLFLTFHRTLRNDIAGLIALLGRQIGLPPDRIYVDNVVSFMLAALSELGVDVPLKDGDPNYSAVDSLLDETRAMLVEPGPDRQGDVERLLRSNPERFAWDYVFIDEAQDCSNAERDFLRALYGHRRLVLADGVDQLVRRQSACDWNAGISPDEREAHELDSSLRMLRNVAIFANCFARALGIDSWRIEPHEELAGGRVIVVSGDIDPVDVLPALVRAADRQQADPVDCLVCLPPRDGSDAVRERLLAAGTATGIPLWDGTLPQTRMTAAENALRMVRYESCRGLEGWITLAIDLDVFAANKRKHPNLNPNDPAIDLDVVVNRALLIPVTRAVHTLVLTVRDPESWVARVLREAAADPSMPRDVVEFVAAADLPRVLAPD